MERKRVLIVPAIVNESVWDVEERQRSLADRSIPEVEFSAHMRSRPNMWRGIWINKANARRCVVTVGLRAVPGARAARYISIRASGGCGARRALLTVVTRQAFSTPHAGTGVIRWVMCMCNGAARRDVHAMNVGVRVQNETAATCNGSTTGRLQNAESTKAMPAVI